MLWRYYQNKLDGLTQAGKVLVIYGPRQVGKTTMIQSYLSDYHGKVYSATGEDAATKEVLSSQNIEQIRAYFGSYDLLFFDEAQMVPNVGMGLKIIVDHLPQVKVIATGSSSFSLSAQIGEPLVGRQRILRLFPMALLELEQAFGWATIMQRLDHYLVYGSYPEAITLQSIPETIEYLEQIRDGYLFKDILMLEQVRHSEKIMDLLRLVAYQIGQEVSIQELGNQLGMSKNTVERYLDLLEKAFVMIRVRGFARNLRKEVRKSSRFYFYDNGVRNAIIGNFNPFNTRDDRGALWENFLYIERMKKRAYHQIHGNHYFWRTYSKSEIDLIEERDGKLHGFEFKYRPRKITPPKDWIETYDNATYEVIHRDNFKEFVT